MRAGDNDARKGSAQSRSTAEHSFDELARGLASGSISRGKALRLLGGALAGAALASVPGVGWAVKKTGTATVDQTNTGDQVATNTGDQSSSSTQTQFNPGGRGGDVGDGGGDGNAGRGSGGNSACARCCTEMHEPGPERGECISAGARGECPCLGNGGGGCLEEGCTAGLCLVCDEASGLCVSECQSGAGCCSGVCTPLNTVSNCGVCGGACTAPANATAVCTASGCDFTCNEGFTRIGGACCANADVCGSGTSATCGCGTGEACCGTPGICTQLGTTSNCLRCGDACTAPANATAVCDATNGCDFACDSGFTEINGACCPDADVCLGGAGGSAVCGCPSGEDCCGATSAALGICVAEGTVANCAGDCVACTTAVANADPVCNNGVCDFECRENFTEINGACCPDADVCLGGAGGSAVCGCPSGEDCCGATSAALGICVAEGTVANCAGDCVACTSPKTVCNNGTCVCPAITCSGVKVQDPTTCQCVCPSGTTTCGNTCCTSGQCCSNGTCVATCPTCQTCSNGTCVTVQDDTTCGTNRVCCNGVCCQANRVCCNGVCCAASVRVCTPQGNCT